MIGNRHTLLSNLGINTSQLSHTISNLPSAEQALATRPRRRRHAPTASRLQPLGDMGPSYAMGDTDVAAWGRNYHEMIILSGIEVQRQRVSLVFMELCCFALTSFEGGQELQSAIPTTNAGELGGRESEDSAGRAGSYGR